MTKNWRKKIPVSISLTGIFLVSILNTGKKWNFLFKPEKIRFPFISKEYNYKEYAWRLQEFIEGGRWHLRGGEGGLYSGLNPGWGLNSHDNYSFRF